MFRPPINRAMRVLDRAFFQKDVHISAARIFDVKNISRIRNDFAKHKDILSHRQLSPIRDDPTEINPAPKCLLLRPEIKHDDESTWTPLVSSLASSGQISLIPYVLRLDYDIWSAYEILEAILPEELHDDIPTGFNPVGHIAHFNIRERYQPYKEIIGQIAIDKNGAIETAVNKTETLGEENEFRVLDLEVIAGRPEFNVEVVEDRCIFRFDFSKVFWNSRLGTEHARLTTKFNPGEAVCDVMAGVGPFAIPAAKKGLFVWANDLNPDCFTSLKDSVAINKVVQFVTPFCEDGHTLIKAAAKSLYETPFTARIPQPLSRTEQKNGVKQTFTEVKRPVFFSHFVMNLPATAIDFLPDFAGLYSFLDPKLADEVPLPMVHCYCFGPKISPLASTRQEAGEYVCDQISERLKFTVKPDASDLDVFDVRDVAPNKSQYCASFRLPKEVAWRGAGN